MLVRNVQRLARTRQTQTVTKHAPQSYKPVRAYATGRRPRLENKVALITGASAGIGHETSLLFAEEGAKLVLVDIDEQKGQETLNAVHKQGGEAIFVKADDNENMIAAAEQKFGKLNVLFLNAGISHAKDDDAINTEEAVWDLTMNVNLKGVFLGCKYGIPALRRAGGGSIINTASFVALLGAATPQLAYTASKGGVLGIECLLWKLSNAAMTRELAVIHARENIRVNALCPGPLKTELLMKYLDTDEKKQRRLVHIPMGRFGLAEEIAKGVLFLASDESSFVTGSTFLIDGGITAAYVTPL